MKKRFRTSQYIRTLLITLFPLFIFSCSFNIDVNKPVDLLWDKSGEKSNSLIVFLPGIFDTIETFKEEKFFSIARKSGIKADMVAANIHINHLLQKKMIERIEKDIFQYAKDFGYRNIWLVGVSLGGLNSLLFYQKHTKEICGVVVLAPYLANENLIKELQQAGSLKNWQPGSLKNKKIFDQRLQKLWVWLKEQEVNSNLNQIFLGFGQQDRYIEIIKIFENILTKKNVVAVEGKHNWVVGRKIWQQQLLSRAKTGLLQRCN